MPQELQETLDSLGEEEPGEHPELQEHPTAVPCAQLARLVTEDTTVALVHPV